jgi:threonyl-tRNA synthetase
MGSDEVWDNAENALAAALKNLKLNYKINAGDGAFYGPKLDIMVTDAIGRAWQLGTLQCDFNLANRFELEFVGEDNKPHRPVVLHRAVLGSLERFLAVYIEHCAGHFPTWLAPTQVTLINITASQEPFLKEIYASLRELGIRAELDLRYEKLGYKIREAQLQKIPYMLVAGDKEVESKTVSVRLRNGTEIKGVSVQDFIKTITQEVRTRSLVSSYNKP